MTRTRLFLITPLLLLAIVGAWLWWVRPQAVDMSVYAPADSLLYLESNDPTDIAAALAKTDAWKLVDDLTGNQWRTDRNKWSRKFVRWTGIGPISSVIVTRAQLAVVVTDLGISQDNESLTVKPEGALLVETHTAASRIKSPVEQALKNFAETAYGQPTLRRINIDGFEFIEWIAPGGSRQVVATITGTLVIVGNTERAVQKTLAVATQRLPNLKDDRDLKRLRLDLQADQALAFGYVPAKSSGRLLSVAVPMLLGRAPGNSEFARLLDSASAKVVASLGWSSMPLVDGIEDRYRIDLQPAMVAKLKESFSCQQADPSSNPKLPDNFSSVTYYRFQNPMMAWQGLKASVASQVDALSAIFFSSLLKSALLLYGVSEPDKFLGLVDGQVITARLDRDGAGSMLIARMRDQNAMRELLIAGMAFRPMGGKQNSNLFSNSETEFVAGFVDGFVAIGSAPDVARYAEQAASTSPDQSSASTRMRATASGGSCVLTYANDSERVRAFVSALVAAGRGTALWSRKTEEDLGSMPYSATETNLGEHGIVRVTRSSLGQFSTLLPLVLPEGKKTDESPGR
jgi:hypothetical protein